MNGKEKVSVIVPVYNVEKFLETCVNSIIDQTYSEIEILLIDDGSTDSSGEICDKYQNTDSRIRVIHQDNQGLAEVRNVGIKEARGEYFLFVDSDDWIEPNTIERNLQIVNEYNADIVCFRFTKEYEHSGSVRNEGVPRGTVKIFDKKGALENLFYPKYVDTITCNKFVRKEMFQGIVYPKGKLHEDLFTTYKFVANASKVVCIDEELYHYYQNPDSIGHRSFSKDTYDIAIAVDESCKYIIDIIGGCTDKLLVGSWFRKLFIINSMINSRVYDHEYIMSLRREMKVSPILKSEDLGKSRKIQMALLYVNFGLYKTVYLLLKKLRFGKKLITND